MKRTLALLALAAASAACVSVESLPDAHGALGPDQRLVVFVFQAPGPWIVSATDSKAETGLKISPLGFLVQDAENQHTLKMSKWMEQYMPRPRYWLETQDALIAGLSSSRKPGTVVVGEKAGVYPAQIVAWNKAKDQLDWRARYYAPDPTLPPARDYSRVLALDGTMILDANLSFGTQPADSGDALLPTLSIDARVYRGSTGALVWEKEFVAQDQTSSMTLTDFQADPSELTRRLETLAPKLGLDLAAGFADAFGLPAPRSGAPAPAAPAGGLVPMSQFHAAPPQPPRPGMPPSMAPPAPPPAVAPAPASSTAPATTVSSGAPAGFWGGAFQKK
jgi:hypothetical protein